MYMYLKSNDCLDIFPDNKTNHFFVKLPNEVNYNKYKSCALVQLDLPDIQTNNVKDLVILCNFVVESFVGPRKLSILQRIVTDMSGVYTLDFSVPQYVNVKNLVTDIVEVIIKNGTDMEKDVQFVPGITYCVLHFLESD